MGDKQNRVCGKEDEMAYGFIYQKAHSVIYKKYMMKGVGQPAVKINIESDRSFGVFSSVKTSLH